MDTFFAQLPLLLGMPEASTSAGSAGAGGQLVSLLVTFGLIIVIFYFLIIRPQSKKQKDTQKMLSALKRGDKVVTIGGMRGIIHSVKEDTVIIKVDDATKLEFSRSAVATILAQAEGDAPAASAKEKPSRKGRIADKSAGNGTQADDAEAEATENEADDAEKSK
jgi:preprotein translocase subunit YajC